MFPDIPGCGEERGQQASGKNSARLQGVEAEDLADMRGVVAPLVNDVEHLSADNATEDNQNPQVPRLVAVVSQPFGVAHTDPESDQDAHGNQESVRRQEKLS